MSNFNLRTDNTEYKNINLSDALRHIEKLDGFDHTIVALECDSKKEMLVGGGDCNEYIVTYFFDGENYTLLSGDNEGILRELCVGGQYADFDCSIVVSKEKVINSVKWFFSGDFNKAHWKKEN